MIYTVTLNPSIDYIVQLPTVQLGELNRMTGDIKLPGGKGINVSRVLNNIGQESTALGFIGGFTGRFITDWLKKEAVGTDFVEIEQDTRINVKVKADIETEINAAGPAVSEKESEQLLQQMDALTADDIVVLSGNKPPTLPEDFYQQMVKKISAAGADFVIDTTGKELMNAIGSRPLLV